MRKIEIVNNNINNTGIDKNIVLISDIHISYVFDFKILDALVDNISNIKPDYIFIAGDILDRANYTYDENITDKLIEFLTKLGNICKVFVIIGNHDITYINKKNKKEIYNNIFFNKLNNINNVCYLDNNFYEDDDIYVYGFNKEYSHYKNEKKFVENLEVINSDKYKILLTHSPLNIGENNYNLILCGHMHNGMILPKMDKLIKNNYGIVGPQKYPLPNYARGTFNIKNSIVIVSGGVTKISENAPKALWSFDKMYPISIDVIKLNK